MRRVGRYRARLPASDSAARGCWITRGRSIRENSSSCADHADLIAGVVSEPEISVGTRDNAPRGAPGRRGKLAHGGRGAIRVLRQRKARLAGWRAEGIDAVVGLGVVVVRERVGRAGVVGQRDVAVRLRRERREVSAGLAGRNTQAPARAERAGGRSGSRVVIARHRQRGPKARDRNVRAAEAKFAT